MVPNFNHRNWTLTSYQQNVSTEVSVVLLQDLVGQECPGDSDHSRFVLTLLCSKWFIPLKELVRIEGHQMYSLLSQ